MGKGLVEVLRQQVEVAEVELGRRGLGRAQRVDVGEEVPAHAVGVEQLVDPRLDGRLREHVAIVRLDSEAAKGERPRLRARSPLTRGRPMLGPSGVTRARGEVASVAASRASKCERQPGSTEAGFSRY